MEVDILKVVLSDGYKEILYNTLLNYYDKDVLYLMMRNLDSSEIFKCWKPVISDETTILIGCNKNRSVKYFVDIVININDDDFHIKTLYGMTKKEFGDMLRNYTFYEIDLDKKVTS
jgi:hypothetical protein